MARTLARTSCLLLALLLACGGETPRDQLAQMGVPFSAGSFLDAAEDGDLHVVRLFLAAEMAPNESDASRRTVLAAAAAAGHDDVVAELLAAGADPNVSDQQMRTPLMAAAEGGHAAATRRLLEAGGNANSLRMDGVTVLMRAARGGHTEVIDALVGHGVEIDRPDQFGNTALLHAAEAGHAAAVVSLLAGGADPDLRTRMKGTHALGLAAGGDDVEMARALLDAGADLERRDLEHEMTALAVASLRGNVEVARLLVERGADPESVGRDGHTALMLAADEGHAEIARLLLGQGAEVDRPETSGVTALMIASAKGHESVVEALLEAGADPTIQTEGRYSALSAARHEGHDLIAAALRTAARARVAARPGARQWARFALYGDAYAAPAGWEVVDPFRSDDVFWSDYSLVGVDPGEGPRTRRALLRNGALHSQILLVRGPTLEWMPRFVDRVAPLDGRAGIRFTDHTLRSADGVTVDYLKIDLAAVGDEPARRQLLGIVDLGREALIVDAGGPADRFDPTVVEGLLRSLRVRTGPAAAVPTQPAAPEAHR
ncbi:MAG: ankyrin repeat domain-containing protein [Deltaproteobacteria bacterium]|nr:ankyrin repeat domain-containing protein [Deltaproteobacteria bacterium]MBW2444296.1 ankyrin repeat domain-containing protein [Deltaproteobacteria bacterium]